MAERGTGRSSRGRNPRSRRGVAATQRLRACYLPFGPGGHGGPLFKMQGYLIK